jgi:hypothetical protein
MPNTSPKLRKSSQISPEILSKTSRNPLKIESGTLPKHHFKLYALILVFLINLGAIWGGLLGSFGIQNPYKNMLLSTSISEPAFPDF